MVTALAQITLEAFLASSNIDESPAWELINRVAVQKTMPTLFHSRLQKRLLGMIDQSIQHYEASPELRCVLVTGSVF